MQALTNSIAKSILHGKGAVAMYQNVIDDFQSHVFRHFSSKFLVFKHRLFSSVWSYKTVLIKVESFSILTSTTSPDLEEPLGDWQLQVVLPEFQ